MRVLVVEDDESVGAPLVGLLRHHGFEVARARTGREAVEGVVGGADVVLLDLGLPDRDGFEVMSEIKRLSDVPVLCVTARGDVASRLHGLDIGADDYVVKPYDVRELVARIHAVSRRARPAQAGQAGPAVGVGTVTVGPLTIDADSRTVCDGGLSVALTRKEFDVLSLLARSPGVVFRREQICSEVWQSSWQSSRRTLEVHVASMRSKLVHPEVVETVRGVGYRLVV